jgi:hypothetical protein
LIFEIVKLMVNDNKCIGKIFLVKRENPGYCSREWRRSEDRKLEQQKGEVLSQDEEVSQVCKKKDHRFKRRGRRNEFRSARGNRGLAYFPVALGRRF